MAFPLGPVPSLLVAVVIVDSNAGSVSLASSWVPRRPGLGRLRGTSERGIVSLLCQWTLSSLKVSRKGEWGMEKKTNGQQQVPPVNSRQWRLCLCRFSNSNGCRFVINWPVTKKMDPPKMVLPPVQILRSI